MTDLKHAARKAESSDAAEWGARAGLVARGTLWLVVAILAAEVAAGGEARADRRGALRALKDQPFGELLLFALAAAFAAHACYRLLEAIVGRRDESDARKRMVKRLWSLSRVAVYGFLAGSTLVFVLTGSSGGSDGRRTGGVLAHPAGRVLIGLIGAGVVIGGLVQGARGLREDFTKKLSMPSGGAGTVVKRVGTAGLVGRGLVYALVGSFLVQAALAFDPAKAEGLDQDLKSLAHQPFGTFLLLLAVVCLFAFAAWSFVEARYRRV